MRALETDPHISRPGKLRDGVRQRVANAIEGIADRVREALHSGNGAETNQSCDQGVLNKVLTGLFNNQVLQDLLHVLHLFCFSSFQGFRGTPG